MNQDIQNLIEKYSEDVQSLFIELRELVIKSVPSEIEEKLWAKLPSYYTGKNFVRIIPFKDHINIEAAAILEHKSQLEKFNITPKGMLQIYLNQNIPYSILRDIFIGTLVS